MDRSTTPDHDSRDVETLFPGDQSPGLAAMSTQVRSILLLPRDPHHEFVRVMTHATVEKRTEDYDDALGRYLARGASRFEAETKAAHIR
jgi:hypothetical protein